MKDRITVNIACYSKSNDRYLEETIDSIRSQGLEPVAVKDDRITSAKWDEAVENCTTEYLHLAHHDDVYLPGFYEQTVGYLDAHPECAAVFTLDYIIDANGRRVGMTSLPFPPKDSYDFEFVFLAMLQHGNFLRCPSFVCRPAMLKGMKRPEKECRTACDTAFWFMILDKHPIGIIPKQLYLYRQYEHSDTQKNVVGSLQRFDHVDAMDYAANLKPDVVPWLWWFMRAKNNSDREALREENSIRELLGRISGYRFLCCHEPPENAGTGILVHSRCRRPAHGDDGEIAAYVFPSQDAFRVLDAKDLPIHRGVPVLPLHPKRLGEAIDKYRPSHVEWHHSLRWPEDSVRFADSIYLHDSYLWCGTWHQVDNKAQICPGSSPERCAACVGEEKYKEVQERKEAFLKHRKPHAPVYANSRWLAALAKQELGLDPTVFIWPVPAIERHDYAKRVGYFGTFSTVKGTDVLLRAATKMPDVQFLLWCEPPKEIAWMMDGRTAHGYPNVLFCGPYHRHNLGALVNLVDLVAVPSRCESFGLVRRECEMLGKKVVATDAGGHGGTVPPGDANALLEAIRRAL